MSDVAESTIRRASRARGAARRYGKKLAYNNSPTVDRKAMGVVAVIREVRESSGGYIWKMPIVIAAG